MPYNPKPKTHKHTNNDAQVSLLRSGRGSEIVMETRLWDEIKLVTNTMRKKEGLADYRWGRGREEGRGGGGQWGEGGGSSFPFQGNPEEKEGEKGECFHRLFQLRVNQEERCLHHPMRYQKEGGRAVCISACWMLGW